MRAQWGPAPVTQPFQPGGQGTQISGPPQFKVSWIVHLITAIPVLLFFLVLLIVGPGIGFGFIFAGLLISAVASGILTFLLIPYRRGVALVRLVIGIAVLTFLWSSAANSSASNQSPYLNSINYSFPQYNTTSSTYSTSINAYNLYTAYTSIAASTSIATSTTTVPPGNFTTTFTEVGLPADAAFSIFYDNQTKESLIQSSDAISFSTPYGNYGYGLYNVYFGNSKYIAFAPTFSFNAGYSATIYYGLLSQVGLGRNISSGSVTVNLQGSSNTSEDIAVYNNGVLTNVSEIYPGIQNAFTSGGSTVFVYVNSSTSSSALMAIAKANGID